MRAALSGANIKLAKFTFAFLTLFALWGVASHVIPFQPFALHGYSAIPPSGCPNIPLQLDAHYDLLETPLVNAKDYTLRTNWVETQTGQDTPLETFKDDFEDFEPGRNKVLPSPHLRTAPPTDGEWQVYSEMVVRGSVLGWPREQIIPGRTYNKAFKTFPIDGEDCSL